jgi:hypothetical protein
MAMSVIRINSQKRERSHFYSFRNSLTTNGSLGSPWILEPAHGRVGIDRPAEIGTQAPPKLQAILG